MSIDAELLADLRRRTEELTADRGIRCLKTALTGVVRAAVATVAGSDGSSITRTGPCLGPPTHASDDEIATLDTVQLEHGEGPCVDAADRPPPSGLVLAVDLADERDRTRWPRFADRAVAAGYRSVLSLQLGVESRRRSSLNFYGRRHHAFDQDAQMTAGLFAAQAALLLHGADHVADLQRALDSRDVIGQAKGILVERFGVDDSRAFAMLVESSQNTNIKLVDVARWLVDETTTAARNRQTPTSAS